MQHFRIRIVRQVFDNSVADILSCIIGSCFLSHAISIFSYLRQTDKAELLVFLDVFQKSGRFCQVIFVNDAFYLLFTQSCFSHLAPDFMSDLLEDDCRHGFA